MALDLLLLENGVDHILLENGVDRLAIDVTTVPGGNLTGILWITLLRTIVVLAVLLWMK